MRIEIRKKDLHAAAREALFNHWSNDIEVLAEVARNHPDAVFFRQEGAHTVEFTATEILTCAEERIEIRPRL